MALLYLSDILSRAGLELSRVKLIRHALSDSYFRMCYEAGYLKEYTQIQKSGFSKGYEYWVVFLSDNGTSAKLVACYQVKGSQPNTRSLAPAGFPIPDWFDGNNAYFDLQSVDILGDMEGRLIVDWGRGTRMWHQKATREKPVIAIQANPRTAFCGFENVMLRYEELLEIINDPIVYENWHAALASIYAIYLIVDTANGSQYIGSAYGKGGLLERWRCYVDTKHGGNKGIRDVICQYPDRYIGFQFSILQILPKTITEEEIVKLENLYKRKLLTKEFGMNQN